MTKLARLRIAAAETDWMEQAVCHGRASIFDQAHRDGPPATTDPKLTVDEARAVRVCKTCPVVGACREWAFAIGDFHGVLGGLSGWQRQQLRKGNR